MPRRYSIIAFALRVGSIKMRTHVNRGEASVTSVRTLVYKLLPIVTRFFVIFIKIPVLQKISVRKKCSIRCLCLRLQINYVFLEQKFSSNNQFKASKSPYSSQWLLPNTSCLLFVSMEAFFVIIKTRGIFRTHSTTLTTYLRYPVNYFLKKFIVDVRVGSKCTSKNLSFLPFHCSFLTNISVRSYRCIASSMYVAIIFIAKKNLQVGYNQNLHSF